MIVKNNQDVIERCLQSVLPVINTWVIVDTGSSDGTQQIIRDFFRKHEISGELHERPWINFEHNQNEAVALAKDKADYILFIDADGYLSFSQGFVLPNLVEESYVVPSRDGVGECVLPRFIKSSVARSSEGAVHKCIATDDKAHAKVLDGVEYVDLHDEARGKDSNTGLKDLELLQADPTSRNMFYIILNYLQQGKPVETLAACEKRLTMGGMEEEVFTAYLIKGKMESELKKDSKVIKESFLKAYSLRPHRLEPLYYLGRMLWDQSSYALGYELMHMALQLPKQEEDLLFVEKWIYDFGFLMQYTLFASMTGHYAEGLKAANQLISQKETPEKDKKAAEECKRYIREHVIQEIQKTLQSCL
jgi:glycosyltransferase involved in cell wall biosynthesis